MAWTKVYVKKAAGKEGRYGEVEFSFSENSLKEMRSWKTKTGETFYTFKASPRKSPDNFGNTHSVYVTQKDDEGGKDPDDIPQNQPGQPTDDLPF